MNAADNLRDRMLRAYQTRNWLPIDHEVNHWPLNEVYDVQDRIMRSVFTLRGDALAGYKISCTSEADQALIDADEPTYGQLGRSSFLESGARVALSEQNSMLIEPELVLRATKDLKPDYSVAELAGAVEVTGGLELPSSRFLEWVAGPEGSPLTSASLAIDNAVAGLVVLGPGWTRLSVEHFADVDVVIERDGVVVARGHSTRVMASPLRALAWLVGILSDRGVSVTAGTMISSGTFSPPQLVSAGTYRALFSGGVKGPEVCFE